MERYLLDASVLASAINSKDSLHLPCYSFIRNHEDAMWVIPSIAYFEFQATKSRIRRSGRRALRELYLPNSEVYEVTQSVMQRSAEANLFDRLDTLRGADLIYACIAALEGLPLVSTDSDFKAVAQHIRLINPSEE